MTTSLVSDTKRNPFLNNSDSTIIERGDWVMQANCRNGDPDALFVRGAAQRRAAAICRQCPVLMQCRADALDNKVEFGVWGGLTERQRRALLRKNPHITSWAEYLANGGELIGI
ncbi:Transcription factor WhiB [Corynebacterium mustelae]|uniref:Transcriptional regulator WhiB n=1 Tax=Corynebacterium mustelae TaxID=571915 RepID=A0A0G3H1G3_9CORY|nr:WhiB family transcriptional regulator [Corynebacterium mustelae]AKK07244.1 Transcription factor WhiB [Corynebacterium mustelae]